MADLRDLLARAADEPSGGVDADGLARRARRRRRNRQRTIGIALTAIVFVGGAIAVAQRSDRTVARVAVASTAASSSTVASTTTTSTVPPDTVPPSLDIGPALDPDHLRDLPERGVEVEVGVTHTVILIALDGTVIGHLDDFDLYSRAISNPLLNQAGPLTLGRGDHTVQLSGPTNDRQLVDVPGRTAAVPLAEGAVLEPSSSRDEVARLHTATGSVIDLPFGAIDVSSDRTWVTSRTPSPDATYAGATAFDARSGQSVHFDTDCFVGDDDAIGRVDICNDTIHVKGLTIGKPFDTGGHWEAAQVSPDGKRLLAQFSGECEAQSAWFVPLTGSDHRPQLAGPPGTEWDSSGLGWLPDGRAVISYGPGVCGTALPNGPGVYLVSPTGALQSIYPVSADIMAWGAGLWTNAP